MTDIDARNASEGISVAAVTRWFEATVPSARPPFSFSLITGGHSNLTYRVADAAGQLFVLRRPPLGDLLPSAHDVIREHRIVSALWPTPVPVPEIVGVCRDDSVAGRPFYVMRHVDGLVLRNTEAVASLSEATKWAVSESLVEALVALHDVDPKSCGLGDLAPLVGYPERLIKRWRRQWDTARERDLPLIEEVGQRLARNIPDEGEVRILHGDFRLDNVIVHPDLAVVKAVLDWELCTLGDPLGDLGMLLVYWTEPNDAFAPLLDAPTRSEGFPGRDRIVEWYASKSHRDVSNLDFYIALGTWKLAIVLEGVYNRYRAGAYGGTSCEWRGFDAVIPALAASAQEAVLRCER